MRGHWLYARGRALIHLVKATTQGLAARSSPRIDHIAFRMENWTDWEALLERLRMHGIPYQLTQVPLAGELQLFVCLEPGVVVEFVTRLPGMQVGVQRIY